MEFELFTGLGYFAYIPRRQRENWSPKTHAGRVAETSIRGFFAVYDEKGQRIKVCSDLSEAKNTLRQYIFQKMGTSVPSLNDFYEGTDSSEVVVTVPVDPEAHLKRTKKGSRKTNLTDSERATYNIGGRLARL